MCFTACHWARIPTVFYGTKIADAAKYGFSEWPISDRKMELLGKSKIRLVPGFLRKECLELFQEWSKNGKKRTY
jgi:tRNA(Arg) A34 adenosine deaminase TadA